MIIHNHDLENIQDLQEFLKDDECAVNLFKREEMKSKNLRSCIIIFGIIILSLAPTALINNDLFILFNGFATGLIFLHILNNLRKEGIKSKNNVRYSLILFSLGNIILTNVMFIFDNKAFIFFYFLALGSLFSHIRINLTASFTDAELAYINASLLERAELKKLNTIQKGEHFFTEINDSLVQVDYPNAYLKKYYHLYRISEIHKNFHTYWTFVIKKNIKNRLRVTTV